MEAWTIIKAVVNVQLYIKKRVMEYFPHAAVSTETFDMLNIVFYYRKNILFKIYELQLMFPSKLLLLACLLHLVPIIANQENFHIV